MIYDSLLGIYSSIDTVLCHNKKSDYKVLRIDTKTDTAQLITDADNVFYQSDTGRSSQVKAGISDNAGYVLGTGRDKKKSTEWLQNKLAKYEADYLDLLESAAQDIQNEYFQSYVRWRMKRRGVVGEKLGLRLKDSDELDVVFDDLSRKDWLSINVDGQQLDLIEEVQDWWIERSVEESGEDTDRAGDDMWNVGPIARLHDKVSKLGSKISSNKEGAYLHYGLDKTQNSWMGVKTQMQYNAVLDYLTRQDEYKYNLNGVTWFMWTDPLIEDRLLLTIEDSTVSVSDYFDTLYKKGLTPDDDVFLWALETNSGRQMTRHLQHADMRTLQNALQEFADNTSIIRYNFDEKRTEIGRFSVGRMLASLTQNSGEPIEYDSILPKDQTEMIGLALNPNRSCPIRFLHKAVDRFIACAGQNNQNVRAAIIRLYYQTNNTPMPTTLDTNSNNTYYNLGRVFAMLENIQKQALGFDINATITDRYMTGAVATPSRVFPELLNKANSHLSKIGGGLAHNLQKDLAAVISRVDEFPSRTGVEEKGRMLLGYYHQKHHENEERELNRS